MNTRGDKITGTREYIDSVAGHHAALSLAVAFLLAQHKDNPETMALFENLMQAAREGFVKLGSSPEKMDGFDALVNGWIQGLKS